VDRTSVTTPSAKVIAISSQLIKAIKEFYQLRRASLTTVNELRNTVCSS